MPQSIPHLLYFISGFTGLVYEVCWMRQSGLVFGDTAQAAATTLAIFFGGIAIGSHYWGGRAAHLQNPLRAYALLESAVAASALGYFALPATYSASYAPFVERFGYDGPGLTLVRTAVTTALLLPPAVFMGGTFPVMGQVVVRSSDQIGRTGTLLYAINTFGGALGAFLAAFYLPMAFGFSGTYWMAIALTLAVAAAALVASRARIGATREPASVTMSGRYRTLDSGWIATAAFLSGFGALSLEVLWTRMFAQVLHNSVYSFGLILMTFLLSMALGGALAHAFARRDSNGTRTLFAASCAAAALAGLTPFVFDALTGGMKYLSPTATWAGYLWSVFGHAAVVMLPPAVMLGSIFPFLLKLAERPGAAAGPLIGRIAAANTAGAVAGSIVAGFVLIPWIGLWAGIRVVSILYLLLAAVSGWYGKAFSNPRMLPLFALAVAVALLDTSGLTMVRVGKNETVREIWESGQAIVAVIDAGANRVIKVDNYYSLGGTGARQYEETQADLPLLIHPHPRSVFFLGMGTGITAGAALAHPVTEVKVVELIPEVVTAAEAYFGDYVNHLFDDPRAEVVVADGRQELAALTRRYDVIIADLFIPWRAGAASLYSREHFETIRRRLHDGGIFAQWLPLYQLSKTELFIIARTMLAVFPQVTVWRGDFLAQRPIIALVGATRDQPLDPEAVTANYRQRRRKTNITRESAIGSVGLFYGGNLSAAADMFEAYPSNTDDVPVIEYQSPISQRLALGGRASWFTSSELLDWYETIERRTPLERDPYLRALTPQERDSIRAGLALFKANVAKARNDPEATQAAAEEFGELAPADIGGVYRKQLDDSHAGAP